MKPFDVPDINTPQYWDTHQTALDFGLRQEKYKQLAGEGKSIIDLGCGLSPFLQHVRFTIRAGLDFSPETVANAKFMYPGIIYVEGDVTDTGFEDKAFEVSVAGEVIEHLKNPLLLVNEMVRITSRRLIISTPRLEFTDPEHLWELNETDLEKMLTPFGKVKTERIHSERFPGRSYVFATCDL